MTNGTSQGLFIVVAIVIFGIFIGLSNTVFGSEMKTSLLDLFGISTEQTSNDLSKTLEANAADDFIFNSDSGTITGYVGTSKSVVVPMEIEDVEVNEISESAFSNKGLTDVVVPKSVNEIGSGFAANNDLDTMVLPKAFRNKAKDKGITLASTITNTHFKDGAVVTYSDYRTESVDAIDLNKVVTLGDMTLESYIKELLNIDADTPITVGDMRNIESITLENSGVKNLDGLEYATNLVVLDVSGNEITSLKPIKELTKIKYLDVSDNRIEDFNDIAGKMYDTINVDGNPIISYEPLIDNKTIAEKEVNIPNPYLKRNIQDTLGLKPADVITVKDMLQLTEIYFDGDTYLDVSSLNGLEYASNLVSLTLLNANVGSKLTDLTPISNLKKLETINISVGTQNGGDLNDLKPLSNLTNLKHLTINDSKITDLTPLANLTKLQSIDLNKNTRLTDISVLRDLTNLEYVSLKNNSSQLDLAPIHDLPKLKDLLVTDTTFSKWEPYKHTNAYKSLNINISERQLRTVINQALGNDVNKIIRPTDLYGLTELTYAGGSSGDIISLTGIEHAQDLEKIDFQLRSYVGSSLKDLTPLSHLPKLKSLKLNLGDSMKGSLTDVSPLANNTSLEYLSITNSKVKTISSLDNLPNLKYFNLRP